MEFIYVLKCQKDTFYIGKTYNVQIEYNEHLDGTICDFTKQNKPCDIDSIFELTSDISLELVISKYIIKFDKKSIFFQECKTKEIKKYIKNDNKKCICNKSKHSFDKCTLNQKDKFWTKILNKIFQNFSKTCNDNNTCYRCGYYGHLMENCYARIHIDGNLLDDEEKDKYNFID